MKRVKKQLAGILVMGLLAVIGLLVSPTAVRDEGTQGSNVEAKGGIPQYQGKIYTILNKNLPNFSSKQKRRTDAFENYSELDDLGRCGKAYANICLDIMPTEPRGSIYQVHPSGWQKNMGWQRCHLIGFQLAGENANERNLITGTQRFNVSGMLPFENMVDDYVEETGNHVLYRVTPYFKGKELVARGVQMEAWSVEDRGEGICYNVFVFNVARGKQIDYKTGIVTAVGKQIQKICIAASKFTVSAQQLQRKAAYFSMGISCETKAFQCEKITGSNQLRITEDGVVSVKKNTSVGTYSMKVKITAKGDKNYKKKMITKKIRVNVVDKQ
ncbi:DNA/RNA non-specific endonuclease [Lachnospiraceae bacterium XBB1006]|nr:DNA/RNA non-specific endonuclease [Lachnospiraceae bacterium XBB1006]